MDSINKLLVSEQISFSSYEGMKIIKVEDMAQGVSYASIILQNLVDRKTALFLSGGKTPKSLYEQLAQMEIKPGAVGMIDERFGEKFHPNSNELMIKSTGLLRTLELQDIPYFSILNSVIPRENCHSDPPVGGEESVTNVTSQASCEILSLKGTSSRDVAHAQDDKLIQNDKLSETADLYDQKVRELFSQYQKSIAILGVGEDGHTAGLPAGEFKIQNSKFKIQSSEMVISYDDITGKYGKRITMTTLGLRMIDLYLVLVFGRDKYKALKEMFSDGSEEEIPSRFYLRPDIAKKTILVTDWDMNYELGIKYYL